MIGLVGRKVGVTRIFKEDGVSVAVATALLVLGSTMPGTVMAAPFKASASAIQPSNEHFVSVAASHRDADITKEANQIMITRQPKRRVPLLSVLVLP